MSIRTLMVRVALSVLALTVLGGASLGLAVAGGHLTLTRTKPSLRIAKPPQSTLPIIGLAPGDSAQRVTTLVNRSTKTLTRVRFVMAERATTIKGGKVVPAPVGKTTPAGFRWIKSCRWVIRNKKRVKRCATVLRPAPSLLLSDPAGLVVRVETCAKPWTRLPTTAPTYTCATSPRVVAPTTKLPLSKFLTKIPKVPPRGKLYLRTTITLPPGAGNQLQGQSAILLPSFVIPGAR
jgi:hypothetical protein